MILAFFVSASDSLAVTGFQNAVNGFKKTADEAYGGPNGSAAGSGIVTDLPKAAGQIIGGLLAFIGIIFFILIIYGGFIWMTARGNEQQVSKAKDLIGAAVVGLIIILAAYTITTYIGQVLTSNEGYQGY